MQRVIPVAQGLPVLQKMSGMHSLHIVPLHTPPAPQGRPSAGVSATQTADPEPQSMWPLRHGLPVLQTTPSTQTEHVPSAAQSRPSPQGSPSLRRPVTRHVGPVKLHSWIPTAQRSSGGLHGAPETHPSRLASDPLRQKMLSLTPGGQSSVWQPAAMSASPERQVAAITPTRHDRRLIDRIRVRERGGRLQARGGELSGFFLTNLEVVRVAGVRLAMIVAVDALSRAALRSRLPMSARCAGLIAVAVVLLVSPSRARADAGMDDPEVGLHLDLGAIVGLDAETLAMGLGQTATLSVVVRPHRVISITAGAQMFAMYGQGPVAWFGMREGLRLHWGSFIDGFEPDAWIELNHIFGLSGPVARHGLDVGLGIGFPLFEALYAGPSVHLIYTDDPDGTPVWAVTIGLSITGWPARPSFGAPEAWRSRAQRPDYVPPENLRRARTRRRPSGIALLPYVELFGMHALDDDHRDEIGFGGGASASVEFPFVNWIGAHAGVMGMAISAQVGRPAAWAGTQFGLRFHWTPLAGVEGDGWIDAHHIYGVSGGVTTHGADVGLGYSFDVASFLRIGPSVRGVLLTDPDSDPAMILAIGVVISMKPPEPGPGNADGDFTLDRRDACREVQEGEEEDPLNPGCPVLDRDRDGVPDNEDLCDTEPAGDDPDPDRLGCPLRDRDGDGVPDIHDFCPDTAPTGERDPLRDGCARGPAS